MPTIIQQPDFGRRLRQLRAERGLSQRDVAVSAVNPSYVSLLESGLRVPTLDVVLQLARTLEVPLSVFVDDPMVVTGEDRERLAADRLVADLVARSAMSSGDIGSAEARFAAAYREAVTARLPVSALESGIALEEILGVRGAHQARYDLLTELAAVAGQVGAPELVVKVRIDRACAARDTGRFAEALEEANSACHEIDQTSLRGGSEHLRLLSVLISVLSDSADSAQLPHLIDEMLDLAAGIDSAPLQGRTHWTASVAFARMGDVRRAVEHVRQAGAALADPGTPLRDWARFARSAASALLDAEADLSEVAAYLRHARNAFQVIDLPGEAALMNSLEMRFALAEGDPARALEFGDAVDGSALGGFELVRFCQARGRALGALGRPDEAAAALRQAAELCEKLGAFKLAAQVWRELDDIRSR